MALEYVGVVKNMWVWSHCVNTNSMASLWCKGATPSGKTCRFLYTGFIGACVIGRVLCVLGPRSGVVLCSMLCVLRPVSCFMFCVRCGVSHVCILYSMFNVICQVSICHLPSVVYCASVVCVVCRILYRVLYPVTYVCHVSYVL